MSKYNELNYYLGEICNYIDKNRGYLSKNTSLVGSYLVNSIINNNIKHLVGILVSIYAREYCNIDDIVNLNNNIYNMNKKDIIYVLSSIGINMDDSDFIINYLVRLIDIDYIMNIKLLNLRK